MPTADIDGLATRYELLGDGPPLLMFSPGGFDARLENWRTLGLYKKNQGSRAGREALHVHHL